MSQVVEVIERYIVPDTPTFDFPEEDGIPLESNWHRIEINLLIETVRFHWRHRQDFFAGGNMFIIELLSPTTAWEGIYQGENANWLRLFDSSGELIPTEAEAALRRAEAAEAEVERLKAEMASIKKGKRKSQ